MITSQNVTARTIAPALPLDDVKSQLREYSDDSDQEISRLLKAAVSWLEEASGITLLDTDRTVTFDCFPVTSDPLYLPWPPLISIASLSYFDSDNASQTLVENTDFVLMAPDRLPGLIFPVPDTTWPDTKARPDAITVAFKTGFGTTHADIPENAKHLLRLMAAHFDRNREAEIAGTITSELKLGAESLRRTLHTGFYAGAYD